jgi:hypothetical protein
MWVLVRNSPILLFPDKFRVKPYPLKQKKGGWKFAPKGLNAWACLLGKNGAFLETLETRFLATIWVLGALLYAPKACPVKFYGLECWGWALVGSDSWDIQHKLSPLLCSTATMHPASIELWPFCMNWCAESSSGALSALFEPHLSQTTAGSPSSVQAKRCQRSIFN